MSIGDYTSAQAVDAAKTYQLVNNGSSASNPNIVLTGHSLGGGLAGFVGEIYGEKADIFDNSPYELAASLLYYSALAGSPWTTSYYPNGTIPSTSETQISAYATEGEILTALRGMQSVVPTTLSTGTIWSPSSPTSSLLAAYYLHSK